MQRLAMFQSYLLSATKKKEKEKESSVFYDERFSFALCDRVMNSMNTVGLH